MNNENVNKIIEYYKNTLDENENLLLVGLNDDRGFNFQKNYLYILKKWFENNGINTTSFSAYSMFFNKMRHIDYFLKHNVSLAEIETLQKYATENEIYHALRHFKPLRPIAKPISNLLKDFSSEDKKVKLSDSIKEATEPIILYSSGINDIMFETCIDPFSAKGYYNNEKEKYNYALSKVNSETMQKIILGHKNNFENILGLNSRTHIYSLGAYLYSNTKNYDKPFHEFVLEYNDKLESLCNKYGIRFINLRLIEKTKHRNIYGAYFHKVSEIIASEVLMAIALDINVSKNHIKNYNFDYTNDGMDGVLEECEKFREHLNTGEKYFYERKIDELTREEKVLKKTINK